jgi:hypothetical protein
MYLNKASTSPESTFPSEMPLSMTLAAPLARSLCRPQSHSFHRFRSIATSSSCQYSRRKTAVATPGGHGSTAATTAVTTAATKQTKNPFVAPPNSVLAYVGPYAASLRQSKSVAFVFGACGCIAVPATLFLGNTEHLLAIMGKKAVQVALESKEPTIIKRNATSNRHLILHPHH